MSYASDYLERLERRLDRLYEELKEATSSLEIEAIEGNISYYENMIADIKYGDLEGN